MVLRFVGLSGNITTPSKTKHLVETALQQIESRLDVQTELFEVNDFGSELGSARKLSDLSDRGQGIVAKIIAADALVVATPIYKASYTGLLKHLIDLLDPKALLRKPILIAATGGGEKHALVVEHQLRPLFGFFEARVLSTAVHVSDKDFSDGVLTGEAGVARLSRAVSEFDDIFPHNRRLAKAAE